MKTLSILLISLTILTFSLKAQTSEQKEKDHKVEEMEIQQLRKMDVQAKPSSENKTYERNVASPDQKPKLETSPVRKAVSTGGVQTNPKAQPKEVATESKDAQPKSRQIERAVEKKSDPQ